MVGANGAGKTTLLRTVSGVPPATRGEIRFLGKDITRLSPDKRVKCGICQVAEGRQVFGPMSVEDNLLLGMYTRQRDGFAEKIVRDVRAFFLSSKKSASWLLEPCLGASSKCW